MFYLFYKLTKEQQQLMVSEIQTFFAAERDEEISEFAAESVLEFFKDTIAPHFYNAGVMDVKNLVEEQFSAIEDEILTLEKPIRK
ncbi:DUF2164 domain-containing protein [Niallia sp. MER 6]|uniref:DUF2164 domain-containing protein n=1 Tax=Niallia sp. MER 6 TaxID=2939567 RepID=UPI0037C6DCFB